MIRFETASARIRPFMLMVMAIVLVVVGAEKALWACPACSPAGIPGSCGLREDVMYGGCSPNVKSVPTGPSIDMECKDLAWCNTCHFGDPVLTNGKWSITLYWGVNGSTVGKTSAGDYTRCYTKTGDSTGIYTYEPPAQGGDGFVLAKILHCSSGPGSQSVPNTYNMTLEGQLGYIVAQSGYQADHISSVKQNGVVLQTAHYLGTTLDSLDYLSWGGETYSYSETNHTITSTRNPIVHTYYDRVTNTQRRRCTEVSYDSAGNGIFSTTIYGYNDSTPGGSSHQLHYVLTPADVVRMVEANDLWDSGVDPSDPAAECGLDTIDENTLLSYASTVYGSYDSQERVTYVKNGGGGGCCGGDGSVRYAYGNRTETGSTGTYRRIQPLDDAESPRPVRTVELLDGNGQVEYSVLAETDGYNILRDGNNDPKCWITHYIRNERGQTLEERLPSACRGYGLMTTTATSGTGMTGEWVASVTPSETGTTGLVRMYSYYDDSKGYNLEAEMARQGTNTGGGTCLLRWNDYTSHTYADTSTTVTASVYPISESRQYYGANYRATTYSYTYYPAPNNATYNKILTMTVTDPDNNVTVHTYAWCPLFDSYEVYYNDWTLLPDGRLSFVKQGTSVYNFGQVVLSIEDVKTDGDGYILDESGQQHRAPGPFPYGVQNQWANPDGLDVRTVYEYYSDEAGWCNYGQRKATNFPGGRREAYAKLCLNTTSSGKVTTTAVAELTASHMTTGGDCHLAPIQISVSDLAGHTLVSATGVPANATNASLAAMWDSSGTIGDSFTAFLLTSTAGATLCSRTVNSYDSRGRLHDSIAWSNANDANCQKNRTEYQHYDGNGAQGRQLRVYAPDTTMTVTVYDQLGRPYVVYQSADGESPVCLSETFYDQVQPGIGCGDGGASSWIGDGHVTATRRYTEDVSGNEVVSLTVYNYDWLGRLYTTLNPDGTAISSALNMDGSTQIRTLYIGSSLNQQTGGITLLGTAVSSTSYTYGNNGHVYEVTQSAPLANQSWTTRYIYYGCDGYQSPGWGRTGLLGTIVSPAGLGKKYFYDRLGRLEVEGLDATDDTPGDDCSNSVELTQYSYDEAGNIWLTVHQQGIDDAYGINPRITYTVSWFDTVNRPTKTVYYGTNGGTVIADRTGSNFDPNSVSSRTYEDCRDSFVLTNTSDKYIATTYSYNLTDSSGSSLYQTTSAWHYNQVTANNGVGTRSYFDDLGRTVWTIENFSGDGVVTETTSADTNRTTEYDYDCWGRLAQLSAKNPKGAGQGVEEQRTRYFYTDFVSGSRLTAVIYPDNPNEPNDPYDMYGAADCVSMAYHRDGSLWKRMDQRGTEHIYHYDTAGRLSLDSVTALGGADDYVQSVKLTYDDRGRTQKITTYSTADPGQGTVRNEVALSYDDTVSGEGGVTQSLQAHLGATDSNTPAVDYLYGAQAGWSYIFRLISVTYPGPTDDRRAVYYSGPHSNGISDMMTRTTKIAAGPGWDDPIYAQYTYLGAGTVVQVDYPSISGGLMLNYTAPNINDPNADTYPGFDQFGRVIDQKWQTDASPPVVQDRYRYGYDRSSNRIWRENNITHNDANLPPSDEFYTYDGLQRLTSAGRGTLVPSFTAGYTGLDAAPVRTQSWGLDALGNWGTFNLASTAGTLNQTRSHNAVNEITAISGGNWMTPPTYDAAGNMTTGPYPGSENFPQTYVYDAWNRLSRASNSWGGAEYRYDGLGRRIASIVPTMTGNPTMFVRTDYYYNESWQVLEERRQIFGNDALGTDGTPGGARGTVAGPTYAQYIWDLRYIDAPVLRWRDSDWETDENHTLDETMYYCNDANMNVTALIDGTSGSPTEGQVVERYLYDAYGSVTFCDSAWTPTQVFGYFDHPVSMYDNEILYCGYRFDPETGLYHVRARYYQPTLGRWISRDPGPAAIEMARIPTDRKENKLHKLVKMNERRRYDDGMDLYAYARDNPIRYQDKTGLLVSYQIGGLVGGCECCEGIDNAVLRVNLALLNDGTCRDWFEEHGYDFSDGSTPKRSVSCYGNWKLPCLLGFPAWTMPGLGIGVCNAKCKSLGPVALASLLVHELAHHYCTLFLGREDCAISAQEACAHGILAN